MKDTLYIFIIVIHFLADFGLQTDKQAKTKSYSNDALISHVGTYVSVWFLANLSISGYTGLLIIECICFSLITLIFHYCTDYITSRITKKFWDSGDLHNAFVTIGFDQVLHFIQLVYTFKFIFYIHNYYLS